jgi:hypothetical protein
MCIQRMINLHSSPPAIAEKNMACASEKEGRRETCIFVNENEEVFRKIFDSPVGCRCFTGLIQKLVALKTKFQRIIAEKYS